MKKPNKSKAEVRVKPKAMWLSRDPLGDGADYELCTGRPRKDSNGCFYGGGHVKFFCKRDFEAMTGLHLKPGDGPVKVRLVPEEGS